MKAVGQWSDIRYRPMTEADLPRVMNIEPRAYTFHWTEGIFKDCINNGYHMPVMEMAGQVVGYAVFSIVAAEAHLLNITIEPEYMGRGLGRMLLEHVIARCAEQDTESLFLEVRVSNEPANRLYKSMGFKSLGLRKNYYPGHFGREDGVVMGLELVEGGL